MRGTRGFMVAVVVTATAAAAVMAATAGPSAGQARPEPMAGWGSSMNPCGPGLQPITVAGDRTMCTHGPDAPEDIPDEIPSGPSADGAGPEATPGIRCHGDGVSGRRVHVVYARSSDRPDRYAESLPRIREIAAGVEGLVSESADVRGGDLHVRWLTDTNCNLVIDNVVMTPAGDDSFESTISELGIGGDDRKVLVFVDAEVLCGIGTLWPHDIPSAASNHNNTWGGYSRVDRPCWDEFAATHELFHNFGAVQRSAPRATERGHCTDDWDLMCYIDGPGVVVNDVCLPREIFEQRLDCNGNDYFHPNPPPGSYLANHWNTANSGWLSSGAPSFSKVAVTRGGRFTPIAGDFDSNFWGDIFWYAPGTTADQIWFFGGVGTHTTQAKARGGTFIPIAGDFDGNTSTDVIWYGRGTARDNLWRFAPDGSFHVSTPITLNGTFKPIAGDFNDDGQTDIFAHTAGSAPDTLMITNDGQGNSFTSSTFAQAGTFSPIVGDYDNDGVDDILFYNATGADEIWFFTVAGTRREVRPVVIDTAGVPVPGDFDSNGLDDVFVYSSTGPDVLFLNTNGTTFTKSTHAAGAGLVPIPGDFNADGRGDILFYGPSTAADAIWFANPQ